MTATTAIAESRSGRALPVSAGRFAPSPTGALHLGSLATAAASFLDARHHGSRWLLRVEDLDTARVVPGAADQILRTLEALGFQWDGVVAYQSRRLDLYRDAIARLEAAGLAYACSCTRRDIGATDDTGGYAGTCRAGPTKPGPTAMRFRADLCPVGPFIDRLQGPVDIDASAQGDPIIRRRDGLYAYQLAVVVDDADQGVTDVVRGADLLPSTSWQRSLQRALSYPEPRYAHLPLVCEPDGSKLSKSARGVEPLPGAPGALLWRVLALLRQSPPQALRTAPPAELWAWAIGHWRLGPLRGVASLPAD
ncbi:MAG TPA: tRNA glutamyl-Q(34) synthetase GluQRS [Steroidobacteraceae bacterium]|nr:tRNA glutamyl-Q(34) synthetase GluQRS [Steroidobacteraceae bacterium]